MSSYQEAHFWTRLRTGDQEICISNLTHAHSNYLICMHFIINTVSFKINISDNYTGLINTSSTMSRLVASLERSVSAIMGLVVGVSLPTRGYLGMQAEQGMASLVRCTQSCMRFVYACVRVTV